MLFSRKKITVIVKPYGPLAARIRGGTYTLKEGSRLKKALKKSGALRTGMPFVAMINGGRVEPNHVLTDGDEIKILQIIGGG
ncbi:MAG: MoaD/ThiS family protein [Deltaproteobacteria bacterium]|nr:MoaD/ThiS family protein [Candidatus Zymogenaceae bacterium]